MPAAADRSANVARPRRRTGAASYPPPADDPGSEVKDGRLPDTPTDSHTCSKNGQTTVPEALMINPWTGEQRLEEAFVEATSRFSFLATAMVVDADRWGVSRSGSINRARPRSRSGLAR